MEISDLILGKKIKDLESEIQLWAEKRGLWTDSCFKTYLEHHNDEPDEDVACVTVLCSDGGMWQIFSGFYSDEYLIEFEEFMSGTEFYYESFDNTTIHFYCEKEELNIKYLDYFEWEWIQHLVRPDYTNLYEELFGYFNKNPKKMYYLSSRKFEILISEVFQNQGYRTELGKGVADGGIDVKLFKKDEIDEVLTLVQVKKYKPNLTIKLEAVSSLAGIVTQQKANRGLFVTTSRYLPVAKNFAEREGSKLTLADSSDVQRWCESAQNLIKRDKSSLVTDESLKRLINEEVKEGLEGKIVYCTKGYDMTYHDFCIVLKDSNHVALLLKIPENMREYSDSPFNRVGVESPILNRELIKAKVKENVFRVQKEIHDNGVVTFWGRNSLYHIWNGIPMGFNLND